jgi:hypothetical protein
MILLQFITVRSTLCHLSSVGQSNGFVNRGSSVRVRQVAPFAGLVKRSNTADCKSAGICLRRFESYTLHQIITAMRLSQKIYLTDSDIEHAGRGVFAATKIKKGETIEVCPVILLKDEAKKQKKVNFTITTSSGIANLM